MDDVERRLEALADQDPGDTALQEAVAKARIIHNRTPEEWDEIQKFWDMVDGAS